MVKINTSFDADELASIQNIVKAGYSHESAERTILSLREAMKTAHCTDRAEARRKAAMNGSDGEKKT